MTLAEVGAGTLLMGDVKVGLLAFAEVGTGTYFLDVFGASIYIGYGFWVRMGLILSD